MPLATGGSHRVTRSHSALDRRDNRLAPVHSLVVAHTDDDEPEAVQLKISPRVLSPLLRSGMPALTIDLDDNTSADEHVDEADAGNPHLRCHTKARVMQSQPHE